MSRRFLQPLRWIYDRSVKLKLLLVTLLAASAIFAGAPKPGIEKEIKTAEKNLADAMVRGDEAALNKILTDDIRYTHSDASLDDKKNVYGRIAKNPVKSVTYNDSTYRQYGDTVLSSHKLGINTRDNGQVYLYVVMVWVKQNGTWQLANRQSTKLP